jgi:hypothetical protein
MENTLRQTGEAGACALNGTQTGIWFADQILSRNDSYLVAHYTEINGEIDAETLRQLIVLTRMCPEFCVNQSLPTYLSKVRFGRV